MLGSLLGAGGYISEENRRRLDPLNQVTEETSLKSSARSRRC